ncbi:MAG: YceI family protein [Pseudomonadota bacterium]
MTRIALALIAALVCLAPPAQAAPERYEIDPDHLSVGFLVDHIGYAAVLGMFLEGEGSFTYDEETQTLSDLKVEIEADSVFTNHKKRDRHLRGGDFLDADEHEEILFVGTGSEPSGPNSGKVFGDLTILGQTRPVTLDVTLNKSAKYEIGDDDHVLGISARTIIKRSDFGMTYGVENGWVGDEVEVIIELEARRD